MTFKAIENSILFLFAQNKYSEQKLPDTFENEPVIIQGSSMHILTNSQRRHECSSSNNNNTMPGTIYYRTFPISKPGTFPSPNTIMGHPNAKRSRSAIEPMSLGPPAKVAKIEDEEAETPWTCTPSAKVSRTGKKDNMQQILKPIIDKIQSGFERADEKEPISLAVSKFLIRDLKMQMIHSITHIHILCK